MAGLDSVVTIVPSTGLNQIDLSSSDLQRSASLVKQACTDSGFFYVINHGISQELMEEVFAKSRQFFGLPLTEKMKLLRNAKNRGYSPLFDQVLDAPNQIKGDYREGYFLGVEVPEDDPNAQKPHFGPNVWPSEEILGEPIADLCLLHYEGVVSDPSKGIYGAGAHSDFGFLTLLATDDVSGLQICKNKEAKPQTWEYVQPLKGFPPILCQTYLSQRLGDVLADLKVYKRGGE
ncbi:hypothetical protein NL676_012353 [Syzygium grande]|nr:hypothetical protein NL676_012353 [Syzygium grande]